ncbi:MAG: hypothetical protein D3906_02555 [Candidatus Electrothrix sp. AUS1_2]|nr:hypothetical protein [Candidatus Electrothrix sp. AUS1_2]
MAENDFKQQEEDDELPGWTEQPEGEAASSAQSAGDSNSAEQASSNGRQQSNVKPFKQKLKDLSWLLILVLIVVATQFYIQNVKPFFPLPAPSSASSTQQANSTKQAAPSVEPAFVLLGEYKGEVYTYNKGTKRVYAYKIEGKAEREVCKLVEFTSFLLHKDGKLLVVSSRHSTLGGIYLLDLNPPKNASQQQAAAAGQSQTDFKPEPVLLTNREADPYFPRNLSIESDLPLVWGTTGCRFAFVARDIHDQTQSLFIYNLDNQQCPAQTTSPPVSQNTDKLIYTPARHFERITDLVWIKNDTELVFTGINDGQENRYRVNCSGGNFRTWDAQP